MRGIKKNSPITYLGLALLLFGVFLLSSRGTDPSKTSAPPVPSSLVTYKDQENGFEVQYDPSLLDFKENFSITPMSPVWLCKSQEKFSEETLFPSTPPGMQCHTPKFSEFIDYMAPRGIRNMFTSKYGNNVAILYSQIPASSLTSGKNGTLDTYRLFIEAPSSAKATKGEFAGKKIWALDMYMVPRKGTLLCKDNVCDIGEDRNYNLAYCPTDCPASKDWMQILKETFSTLKFSP